MITETDEISVAIELAQQRWPELSADKGKLLRKMLEHSAGAIASEQAAARKHRLATIERLAGSLENVWPETWRDEARAEWPA
jgi:hypothetical protein